MIKRILLKDMKRRKSVNIILFLFIMIASIFLSSSISNILTVASAVDYYMDYAKVPDINFIVAGISEKDQVDDWMENDAPGVKEWGYHTMIMLGEKSAALSGSKAAPVLDANGATLYLGTPNEDCCKVFDIQGEEFSLKKGEVAMLERLAEGNDLEIGDHITINMNGTKKDFTIKHFMKDAAYGSEMVGMSRLMVSQEDYDYYSQMEDSNLIGLYYANVTDQSAFTREQNNQEFATSMNMISRQTYTLAYSFDMIMAALLIVIGICLILIALLVLRFTLVFTIEEEYREIGIMKAVGLKEFAIKKIYLLKYLFLVTSGAVLGLIASVPVSRMMVDSVSKNMIMEDTGNYLWVNVVCSFLVILFVMLFCYFCTRKLNKISAISAIRGGQNGERFTRRAGLRLYRRKWMPVAVFLGMNDMASHVKRYLVMMVTFCLSFILITIPLNTVNTMQSKEMAGKFCMDPDSAVYIESIEKSEESTYKNSEDFKDELKRIESELEENGYHATLSSVSIHFLRYSETGQTNKNSIMTVQIIGPNNDFLTYKEGEAPLLENEIAFSEYIMEQYGWQIGDTVEVTIGEDKKKMLITGTYSDYMQIGNSARMNPQIDLNNETVFDYWNIMVDMETDKTQSELADELEGRFPDYKWTTAQEVVDRNVGGIQDTLKSILIPMTGMLCAVIMLITLLMERLFIVREKGEIAMMKSMGYKNRTIRLWQVLRMVWVALISMFAAIPISMLSNNFVLKPIFAIMGAEVEIQIVPWQVYGTYPGVLLTGIILATILATVNVKKINIRELNNLE